MLSQQTLWNLPEGCDYSVRFLSDERATEWSYCEDLNIKLRLNTTVFDMDIARKKYTTMCENGRCVVQLVRISRYMSDGNIIVMAILRTYVKPPEG